MNTFARAASKLASAIIVGFALLTAGMTAASAQTGTPHVMLQLKDGTVDIELLPALAPKHVERIVALTEQGFYNGIVFHRVIDGFMAQTGDPTGTGAGGSDLPDVVAEFNAEPYVRGTVGAARTADPDTFNSQFFITFADASFLNNQYTVFGKVVAGMEFVDNITKGEPPANPDKIIAATIEYR
ncbi:MAG: Peptidyl-prolyl cis-trans isomerase [Devosia sp.]|nr:Peptidyl-prolyl cis-trans isomerase [Devosia sp.]